MKNTKIEANKVVEKSSKKSSDCPNKPFRGIFQKFLDSQPAIKIATLQDNGDISFKVRCKDLDIDAATRKEYDNEIYTHFFANFAGELFVRENLEEFAKILSNCEIDKYRNGVVGTSHENFGLTYDRGQFIFTFHINFIQKIMFENLRNAFGNNERRRK